MGGSARGRRAWYRYNKEKLLDVRLCDLGLKLEGSWLEDCLLEIHRELDERGIRLHPHAWLSSEFFSPGGVPGFAVPFYLAHPRLMRLERSEMLDVEGGSWDECLRIMRHECGHAVQHAWRLHRRPSWQRHFGNSTRKYPEYYQPNPASRRYVQHLRLYYAQSHPDEDFAETFAVWLGPRHVWRKRYAGWPALRKLEYVDQLMRSIKNTTPPERSRQQVHPLRELRMTLREHYATRREQQSLGHPDVYDRELRALFSDDPRHRRHEMASSFLRRNRTEIRKLVARWTGEYEFTLEAVLQDMIGRCRELKLHAVGPERKLRLDFGMLLTVKTIHFLYSRRQWIAL